MKDDEKLPEKVQELFFEKILSRDENAVCADCNGKAPRWASLSFGVFICMRCAGPHRMLGPIYTKVKSVKLDIWNRSWADTMEKVGNKIANEYFEYKMPTSYRKPNVNSSMQDLERFVHDKYVKRLFSPPEFVDPVTEYLDAKKNGTELNPTKFLSCFSHNFFVQQQGDSFPRPCAFNTERCTKDPNCPSAKVPPNEPKPQQQPKIQAQPKPSAPKNEHQNLLGEEPGDLLAAVENNQDWGDFMEANHNPPLTPKVTASASIMEMYKKPMEPTMDNNISKINQAFPVNHGYMNNMGNMGFPGNMGMTGNAMGSNNGMNIGNMGGNIGMGGNMGMGMNPINNMNNMNAGNNMGNMRNWGMMGQQQMMYGNGFNNGMGGVGFGGGMNMTGGGYPMGGHPAQNLNKTTNNINNSNEKKKNTGDIMNLYNTAKTDLALSGNEMQMNKKGVGQENIMGMYSGNNFNVW